MTTKHIILLAFACISGFAQMNAMKQPMVVTNKPTKPFIPHHNTYKPQNPYYRVAQPLRPEQVNKIQEQVLARQAEQMKQAQQDKQNIDKLTALIQDPDITEKQRKNFRGILQLNPKERPVIAEMVLSQWEKTPKTQKPTVTPMPSFMPAVLADMDRQSYYTRTPEDFLMDPTGLKKQEKEICKIVFDDK